MQPDYCFRFFYEFNSFSFFEQADGSYRFCAEICFSRAVGKRDGIFRGSCVCDESVLISAVNLLAGHQLTVNTHLLPPDECWDDLPTTAWGPFLEVFYRIGSVTFDLYGKDGVCATPRVTAEHPLYSDVLETVHDLTLLFLHAAGYNESAATAPRTGI